MTLGELIKKYRSKNNLSMDAFADKSGISKAYISLLEKNKHPKTGKPISPSIQCIKQAADAMDIDFNILLSQIDADKSLQADITMPKRQTIPGGYDNSIRHWILKTGFGYDEVAQKLGISEDLLMDYVEENITIPYQILITLSEICEVSTDCLLGLKSKSREKDLNDVLPFRYDYRIAKRIRKLCQESNVDTKSSFLESLLCLSSKEVFYLIEYGFIPHMDTLIKLADYFNVSTDYLLCQIDGQSEKVLRSFCQLDEDNKDIIIGKIKECIKEQRHESIAADPMPLKKNGTDNLGK